MLGPMLASLHGRCPLNLKCSDLRPHLHHLVHPTLPCPPHFVRWPPLETHGNGFLSERANPRPSAHTIHQIRVPRTLSIKAPAPPLGRRPSAERRYSWGPVWCGRLSCPWWVSKSHHMYTETWWMKKHEEEQTSHGLPSVFRHISSNMHQHSPLVWNTCSALTSEVTQTHEVFIGFYTHAPCMAYLHTLNPETTPLQDLVNMPYMDGLGYDMANIATLHLKQMTPNIVEGSLLLRQGFPEHPRISTVSKDMPLQWK